MAKIHEELIVIKLSKLHRDGDNAQPLADADMSASLEAVVQQLVDSDVIVEIIKE